MRMPLTFLILSREIVFSERTHHRLQLKTRVDSSEDHVKQIRRVRQRTPITMCRVYASNVRRTSRTVWSLCLLRYDPLDLGKPLTPRRRLVLSSTTPGRQCPGGRTIAHPLDLSAAYGHRVPFTDFWCRHGCSVGVRNGFVQLEFACTTSTISSGRWFVRLYFSHPKFSALELTS
jgi:hypothetical protein